ncbi:MAG: hypothetical protein KKA19_05455, partial [Candidatus Margulisbacteria bacterium]|nr:hypothetical protein [Candidatus Margulisiibacteriota bacterium]
KIFAQEISIALANAYTFEKSKQQQAQLFQSEKMASLGQLVASIAHEIRNPLTGMGLALDNIDELIKSNQKQYAEVVEFSLVLKQNLARLDTFVQNLLSFSRKTPNDNQEFNINDLVSHAVFLIRKQAKKNNIEIITNLDTDISEIKGDPSKIQQVMLNLYLNSIQAMFKGGTLTITTSAHSQNAIEISIADTGCGIPEEYKEKIFEPFFTSKNEGTGLGLHLSKEIIEQLGGKINFKSEINQGTEFIITLPNKSN